MKKGVYSMMKYAKIKYLVAFCVAAQVTAACAAATDAQRVKKGFDRKAAEIRTARLHDAKWGVFNHFLQYGCMASKTGKENRRWT
jgi:hypothetical protein